MYIMHMALIWNLQFALECCTIVISVCEPTHEKTNKSGFLTWMDTNHPEQSQEQARGLELLI